MWELLQGEPDRLIIGEEVWDAHFGIICISHACCDVVRKNNRVCCVTTIEGGPLYAILVLEYSIDAVSIVLLELRAISRATNCARSSRESLT